MLSGGDARSALRCEMSARRDALSAEYRRAASEAIARAVLESAMWRRADNVFAYCSVGSEVETQALIEAALAEGKTLYLPRCARRGEMHAVRLRGMDELRPGRYGIPEPAGNEELMGAPCLCLAPGLAFDVSGGRIGYGGGYYDRFLAVHRPLTAALAYPCQLTERVPTQAHDAPVDYIITPTGIIYCGERA